MVNITAKQIDLLRTYVKILSECNSGINLISRNIKFEIDSNFFEEFIVFLILQKKVIELNQSSDYDIYRNLILKLEAKYQSTSIMYHIINCCQLINFLNNKNIIADIGSGNGMPGILLNILGFKGIFLIETSNKKCNFLKFVISELHLDAVVINKPIQECKNQTFDTLISRAFSSRVSIFTAIKKIDYKDFYTLKQHDFDCYEITKNNNIQGFSFYSFGSDIIYIKKPQQKKEIDLML